MANLSQSVARRIPLKAFLSSDHVSVATGKTIAVVISKNGGAFGNPSAGATNATEIANGWYYVDLSTTDTGTLGPLLVRGTSTGVDDVEPVPYQVVDAHNGGFDGVPSVVAGANGGLPTGDASGRVLLQPVTHTSARIPNVTLADTVTTYTGNTPQTGDNYARIGVAGAGLTALGDTRIANLDTTVSSRTKPADTQAAVTTVTNLTNAPTAGDFTAAMKTSITTAATSATPSVTVSDKTGFSLSTAGILAIWHQLTSAIVTASTIGKLLVDNIDAAISTRTKPADTQAAVTTVATVTNLTNAPTSGDFTAAMKTSLNAATPAVTVSDKTGFSLTSAYDPAKTAAQAGDAMALTSGERTTLAAAVWVATGRTLTSFGTLVADTATAVWGAATRTLSAFGFGSTVAVAVVDQTLSGHTTAGTVGGALNSASSAGDPWNTALPGAYAGGTAGSIVGTNLDATVSSRSSHTAADIWAVGTRTLTSFGTLVADAATAVWASVTRTMTAFAFTVSTASDSNVTAIKAKTDNLPSSPADVSDIPTATANADALLGRKISGGANGGRTVTDALRSTRNKVTISGTTLTVYAEDDVTVAWTAVLTSDSAAQPIVGVDPA